MIDRSRRVALLIDYDNLQICATRDTPGRDLQLPLVIQLAQRYGTVILARAYAEWNLPTERMAAFRAGIEPAFAPVLRTESDRSGKSLADTIMVAEGMDVLWTIAPDVIVLATSDKDLIPLVRVAKQRGTRVVVLGSDLTAIPLREIADEHVTYKQLVTEAAGRAVEIVPGRVPPASVETTRRSPTRTRQPRAEARAEPRAEARAEPRTEARAEPRAEAKSAETPASDASTANQFPPSQPAEGEAGALGIGLRRRRRRGGRRRERGPDGMEAEQGAPEAGLPEGVADGYRQAEPGEPGEPSTSGPSGSTLDWSYAPTRGEQRTDFEYAPGRFERRAESEDAPGSNGSAADTGPAEPSPDADSEGAEAPKRTRIRRTTSAPVRRRTPPPAEE